MGAEHRILADCPRRVQRVLRALSFPNLVNVPSSLECLASTLHDADNLFLKVRAVDASHLRLNRIVAVGARNYLLGIAQNWNVRVMSRKDELHCGLELSDQLDDVLVDGLVVEIVLRLIDDYHVAVSLT